MHHESFFFRTVMKRRLVIFKASLYDINKAIEATDLTERPLEVLCFEQYYQFLPLFSKVLGDRLPPHQPGIDHEVRLQDVETPTWGPLYSLSRTELVVLTEWHEEIMSKGFIRQSSSPFAAPVLFAKKPDGGFLFFIHFWDIHSKMIKNQYALPLIQETLNHWGHATVYTKLEVQGANNLLSDVAADEYKLPFRTRYGLFEPTITQFKMTNEPVDFPAYNNDAIREALDDAASA